ncbi:hypothetical protein ABZ712_33690 [Streptomyces sp. NPDC006906]
MSTQTGPCARCQQPTHRYGAGANPLSASCRLQLPSTKTPA